MQTRNSTAATSFASTVRQWLNGMALILLGLVAGALPPAAHAQVITEFATPNSGNVPFNLVTGPDGNLLFRMQSANGGTAIGRYAPSTGAFTNFTVGASSLGIAAMAAGPDGNLWFTAAGANTIGRLTPGGVVTQFSAGLSPNASLGAITAGPDGAMWFTQFTGNRIGRIDASTGAITEFSLGITANAGLRGIVAGSDGNLWFTESTANKIGRITPAGFVTEYALPTANAGASDIELGNDGNLWFVEYNLSRIGRVTQSGIVTEFSAGISANAAINGLRRGPDNNLWFTEYATNKIGRILFDGSVTEFTVPTAASGPESIASAGGKVWFTERSTGRLASVTPATGAITEIPGLAPNADLAHIAMDASGNHWFVQYNLGQLGRITNDGAITSYSGIPFPSAINSLARGPDGNMWFTMYNRNSIGRFNVSTGAFTEFSAGITAQAGPEDITLGQDGNLWFTERSRGYVGRITPSGTITEFNLFAPPNMVPYRITTTQSGGTFYVWCALLNSDYVVRFNPATIVTGYYQASTNSGISTLTSDASGNVWFTENGANKIGRVSIGGVLEEFSAGLTLNAGLNGLALGTDGNLWFTETTANKIGRITPDGVIREYGAGLSPNAGLNKITAGNDGALWFTEKTANRIGRISLPCDGADTLLCSGFDS